MNQSFGNGGGIYNRATLGVFNSTISGNVSGENGGGIFNGTTAAAVTTTYGATIADNRADYAGSSTPLGDGGGVANSGGTITLDGTIVAGNTDETSEVTPANDCDGAISSADRNLIGMTDGCTYSSQSGDDTGTLAVPLLADIGQLGLHGGPTQTYVPGPSSPAVDNNDECDAPVGDLEDDQRGLDRPQGTFCDIGATERDQVAPTTPTLNTPTRRFLKEKPFDLEWTTSTDAVGFPPIAYDPARQDAPFNGDFAQAGILGGGFNTSQPMSGKKGVTSCFTVSARDPEGNESAESNERCTALPLDDRQLKRKGKWTEGDGAGYFFETFLKTKQEGASLKRPGIVDAKRMILVATKCPGCGKVKVLMAGDLLKTVSLNAASVKKNTQIKLGTFSPLEDGTAKIVVVSEHKLVKIEGLGVSKV
jgi:hypothetical protein